MRRKRKTVLELSTRDVGMLMALIKAHVKPAQYKEGTDVRQLIEDCHKIGGDERVFTHFRIVPDPEEWW